jgi:S1-C subfamily serine protease
MMEHSRGRRRAVTIAGALLTPLLIGCTFIVPAAPNTRERVDALVRPPADRAEVSQAMQAQPATQAQGQAQGQTQQAQGQTQQLGRTPSQAPIPSAQRGATAAAQVYARNAASVVSVTGISTIRTRFGTQNGERGVGSGFIIDRQGLILTNNHVIEDAREVTITFSDKTTVSGTLIGRDPDNDLAVIRVDPNAVDDAGRPIRDKLQPVVLGDSNDIIIGEEAISIGSPLGLAATVTSGIVSAIRAPGEEAGPVPSTELLGGAIQTDAAINPGNSGGPLFNAAGEVIGVSQAILSRSGGNIGIGFAIPVNVVKRVVPVLIERGCYPHPFIGVGAIPLSIFGQQARRELGVPENVNGLLVQEVEAGAARSGLRAGDRTVQLPGGLPPLRVGGDIIVGVDGQRISAGGELRAYVENNTRPGDSVTLNVLRNGQRLNLQVQLTQRPGDQCR